MPAPQAIQGRKAMLAKRCTWRARFFPRTLRTHNSRSAQANARADLTVCPVLWKRPGSRAHRHPTGWRSSWRLKGSGRKGMGDGWKFGDTIQHFSSSVSLTSHTFPLPCGLPSFAKVFQAQLEGKKSAEVNGMLSSLALYWGSSTLCEHERMLGRGGGNQADRDSPAQTCEITELHAHVLRQIYYLARITIIFSLENQHLTLNSHLVLLKANSLITETLAAHLFCLVFYQGCTAEHKQYGAQILHTDDIRPVFVTSKPEEFSLDCSDFYSFKHQFQENCMIL